MEIRCVWEHNGDDSIIYSDNYIGAFARGQSKEIALSKMRQETASYLEWKGDRFAVPFETRIVQEKDSRLDICDADSDVLFDTERPALPLQEYQAQKALVLKSAKDFLALYEAIPDKSKSCLPPRKAFYGNVPRTADEMYQHTKNVNSYYFGEIRIPAGNEGTILECRRRGFEILEGTDGFLANPVYQGSYGEEWSLRKVLRRFLWHDRIHAKAMYRMAIKTFGPDAVPNLFCFPSYIPMCHGSRR